MSHWSALDKDVKSELVLTVNVSVNATHGNVDVASFQLLSNTGTFQLEVQVSFVDAVHKLALLAGVYPRAVVTSVLFIQVINPLSLVRSLTLVGNAELVINQLSLVKSDVFVGTGISIALLLAWLSVKSHTFVPFFCISIFELRTVGTAHPSLISFHEFQS